MRAPEHRAMRASGPEHRAWIQSADKEMSFIMDGICLLLLGVIFNVGVIAIVAGGGGNVVGEAPRRSPRMTESQ